METRRTRRILSTLVIGVAATAAALSLAGPGGPTAVGSAPASTDSAPAAASVVPASAVQAVPAVETLTTRQTELVEWALARFTAAGLDVPEVTVEFTPGRKNCGGFVGLYRSDEATVSICADDHASDLVLRSLLLHEIGHAWVFEHVSAEGRDGFVTLRNAASWASRDDAWVDRAAEHAAEVISWGLMDEMITVDVAGDTSEKALATAFRYLTGVMPINDGSVPASNPTKPATQATTSVR